MSGRLIILPKKSYCPWKPENVERVLADECLAKEKLRTKNEQCENELQIKTRLNSLRATKDELETKRFNLFEDEQGQYLKQCTEGQEKTAENTGVLPVVLGATELKYRGGNRPFYAWGRERQAELSEKEEKRKDQMDPMQPHKKRRSNTAVKDSGATQNTAREQASSNPSRKSSGGTREARRRRKGEQRRRRKHRPDSDGIVVHDEDFRTRKKEARKKQKKRRTYDSVEEMRLRRQEREGNEAMRAAEILRPDQRQYDQRTSYQNQNQSYAESPLRKSIRTPLSYGMVDNSLNIS